MQAYERLLKYCRIETTSSEHSKQHPSTENQFILAKMLKEELIQLGVKNVRLDRQCYVYGELPASEGYETCTPIGFIAHMDTSPDASGKNVKPQLIKDYDGGEVLLTGSGKKLSPDTFPHLKKLIGRTLITTDGTTLLGADDKAGIAEIMTAMEELINENICHGPIFIAFTPDEEIGEGMDGFSLDQFPAQYAYTIDGGAEGEIEYENFNAASVSFYIKGRSVHPGDAKGTMVNAALLAYEINRMLPEGEIPALTEGYEGFYHLVHMKGDVNEAELSYIVRDHDDGRYQARLLTLKQIEKVMKERYYDESVMMVLKESYRNMAGMVKTCFHIVEKAESAIKQAGLVPVTNPIRGGTDGARLSFMGIPCPNLGTGGYAFHGVYEHITVEGMELSVKIIRNLIAEFVKEKQKEDGNL